VEEAMIRVNGDETEWREGMTVQDVLVAKNYRFPLLIVSINEAIVPKPDYGSRRIPDGADVRVIHLMSGG
jgi:sulfur carrier protein